MTGIIVLLIIITLAVVVSRVVSASNQRKTKDLLKTFESILFEKIDIFFSQSSVGKGAVVGGLPINATMYFSDNLILITKDGGFSANLPLIIAKDITEPRKIMVNGSTVNPGSFKITSWNSITMKYQRQMISTVECTIQINFHHKTDFEKISRIKNWC